MGRSPESKEYRRERKKHRNLIERALNELLFYGEIPKGIVNLRKALQGQIKAIFNKKPTLKTLDVYSEFWNPRFKRLNDFQNYGMLIGQYFPTGDNIDRGIFATDMGVFPAELSPHLTLKAKWNIVKVGKRDFGVAIQSIKKEPFFNLIIFRQSYEPSYIKKTRQFKLRGEVKSYRQGAINLLYIDKRDRRINIKINDVTNKLKKGDFVALDCTFEGNKLHCFRSVKV